MILASADIQTGFAADAAAPVPYDYSKPPLLTGTLYAIGSDQTRVLYRFRRTATREGAAVHVDRRFIATNGTLAAEEKVLYESNQLVSFEMKDFQADVSGAIHVEPTVEDPVHERILIGYGPGLNPPQGHAAPLQADTVIDDTLYPFMIEHWRELMQGMTVRFHFVSLDRERTFEFGLTRTGEVTQNGERVIHITMKPVSMFVSAFVKPIVFAVQANGSHLILSYVGRTTPRIRRGNSWKDLDAVTVFHYPGATAR